MRFYKKPVNFLLGLLVMSCVSHDLTVEGPDEPVCDPLTSWQTEILPIMQISCATSGCHDGISRRNWTDYNEVKQYSNAIKERTVNRSMPFDEPLPQDQINKIACWVDNGALNN